MKTGAELRRANLRVLLAMVIFALLLAAACILWMRAKVQAQTSAAAGCPEQPAVLV